MPGCLGGFLPRCEISVVAPGWEKIKKRRRRVRVWTVGLKPALGVFCYLSVVELRSATSRRRKEKIDQERETEESNLTDRVG